MGTANILIVEDEAIVAADLANRVRRLGYGVTAIVARGEDAVELARHARPDLVLMDLQLAGSLDGIEAAEVIRRDYDTPIIFLTAHSDPATLERAEITGPSGYVLKPFDELELRTHIEAALSSREADRRRRSPPTATRRYDPTR